MTQDEMVGWHHQLKGHEFTQTQGDVEGQGSLACCCPWGRKELDMTEQLNNSHHGKQVEVSQKIKNAIRSSNSTPGYLLEENKNTDFERFLHSQYRCSITNNNQDQSINRSID